jgi:hypothetical protein
VWVPLLVGVLAGRGAEPVGLTILLALFIFIPGVYVIANMPRWGKVPRALACVAYVAFAEVVTLLVFSGMHLLWKA